MFDTCLLSICELFILPLPYTFNPVEFTPDEGVLGLPIEALRPIRLVDTSLRYCNEALGRRPLIKLNQR